MYGLQLLTERATSNGVNREDDPMILYYPDKAEWEQACGRMRDAGFTQSASFNPYWDVNGCTFVDHDGYQNGLALWMQTGSPLTGCANRSSLACSIRRGVCSVPGISKPPYRSQPKIGWPSCWQ